MTTDSAPTAPPLPPGAYVPFDALAPGEQIWWNGEPRTIATVDHAAQTLTFVGDDPAADAWTPRGVPAAGWRPGWIQYRLAAPADPLPAIIAAAFPVPASRPTSATFPSPTLCVDCDDERAPGFAYCTAHLADQYSRSLDAGTTDSFVTRTSAPATFTPGQRVTVRDSDGSEHVAHVLEVGRTMALVRFPFTLDDHYSVAYALSDITAAPNPFAGLQCFTCGADLPADGWCVNAGDDAHRLA